MTSAVLIQGVSKTYPLFTRPTDRLRQLLRAGSAQGAGVDALRNIDLTIEPGQIFGIVGKNGSGKSTLLRLLSGVIPPTSGTISATGKVAALLELGAGFNPEFSGRDNVLITCALLGIDDATALARLPDIEAFADVGAFFDRPVKTYSTGMYARVAFAALAVCEPEVLILDEILAVGDEAFQRKCLARLETLAKAGCTIILVTHNSQLVIEFCHAAALLAAGELIISGEPKAVIHEYYKSQGFAAAAAANGVPADHLPGGGFAAATPAVLPEISTDATPKTAQESAAAAAHFDPNLVSVSTVAYGNAEAQIDAVRIIDAAVGASDQPVNVLLRGGHYRLCYRVSLQVSAKNLEFGCLIKTAKGVELAGRALGVGLAPSALAEPVAGSVFAVTMPFVANLLPGTYFANAGVRADIDGAPEYLHRLMDALIFRVLEEPNTGLTGMVDLSIAEDPPSFETLTPGREPS